MKDERMGIIGFILFSFAFKWLCFSLYYSTDLYVHHYWISLTGSKSWSEWYIDETAEGTLDYPPLFAIFQLFLYYLMSFMIYILQWIPSSSPIQFVGKSLEDIISFPPKELSLSSIYILRTTVLISDVIFIYSLYK